MNRRVPIWEKDTYITNESVDEFYRLIQRNPILHNCWTAHQRGEISLVLALMSAIKFLIKQNENMFKTLVVYVTRYGAIKDENEV